MMAVLSALAVIILVPWGLKTALEISASCPSVKKLYRATHWCSFQWRRCKLWQCGLQRHSLVSSPSSWNSRPKLRQCVQSEFGKLVQIPRPKFCKFCRYFPLLRIPLKTRIRLKKFPLGGLRVLWCIFQYWHPKSWIKFRNSGCAVEGARDYFVPFSREVQTHYFPRVAL